MKALIESVLFAAAVPMAGFSDPNQINNIKHIPFGIFHGDIDTENPVQGSRNMYRLLQEARGTVKYSEYARVAHTPTFRNAWKEAPISDWIFAQKKRKE